VDAGYHILGAATRPDDGGAAAPPDEPAG
jgi:hypothetical protein